MSSALDILQEMGFSKERAQKALEVCGDQTVEAAMEWLIAHADEPMETDQAVATVSTPPPPAAKPGPESEAKNDPGEASKEATSEDRPVSPGASAKSYKCDDCGKLFKSAPEVEFHAVKSGHQSFSESTEEVKPLTEEEKIEKAKKLEEKIRQRRLEREEKEKKEAIEREKERRKFGQEIATTRQKIEEQEMMKLAEEKRREKMEAMLAKKRVLEEIERDKQERRERFNMGPPAGTPKVVASPPAAPVAPQPQKEYDQCRLQIRLTNGETLTQTFGAHEELAAVRLYVELNRTDGDQPFTLMTSFPRKVFAEEDFVKPLSALGLVPSAVVILTKSK